jgi:hypothetical protein
LIMFEMWPMVTCIRSDSVDSVPRATFEDKAAHKITKLTSLVVVVLVQNGFCGSISQHPGQRIPTNGKRT